MINIGPDAESMHLKLYAIGHGFLTHICR